MGTGLGSEPAPVDNEAVPEAGSAPDGVPADSLRITASSRSPTGSVSVMRVKTGTALVGGTPTPTPVGLHAAALTPGPALHGFVTLGRYQLLSRLAVGGMAEVYLARQGEITGFKTLVVVKKVLPHLAVKPDFIDMFLDEARIASMLDHPNIVHIAEVGRAGDEYFIAMELVQGKPLAALLQHGEKAKTPLPHDLAALIVANAAAGLHYAHELTDAAGTLLGLVHRDVSPQNIMISFEGSVKVIDFGIARALGRLGDTNSGSLKGKLGYMAPEQARGEAVDLRADIFSLGVVLWECVAARRLFLRENELATLRAVAYDPILPPSTYAEVDGTLEAIIMCALERDPEGRFQSAEEMRIALEKWNFAAGGTSTHALSLLMKAWFPSEHVQWQRAARLALDMQESDTPIDIAFPSLASRSPLSRTGISRPDTGTSASRLRGDVAGPNGVVLASPQTGPQPQPAPRPAMTVALIIGIVAAVGLGGLLVYRGLGPSSPAPMALPVKAPPPTTPMRPTVEILPSPSAEEPVAVPAPPPHNAAAPNANDDSPSPPDKKHTSATGRRTTKHSGKGPSEAKPPGTKRGKDFRPNPF